MKVVVAIFVSIFVVVEYLGTARAALSLDLLPADPANPGTCVRKSDGINLKLDESKFGPGCIKTSCIQAGNGSLALQEASCGVVISKDCMKFEDETKPYPDCCKKIPC